MAPLKQWSNSCLHTLAQISSMCLQTLGKCFELCIGQQPTTMAGWWMVVDEEQVQPCMFRLLTQDSGNLFQRQLRTVSIREVWICLCHFECVKGSKVLSVWVVGSCRTISANQLEGLQWRQKMFLLTPCPWLSPVPTDPKRLYIESSVYRHEKTRQKIYTIRIHFNINS